MLMAVMRLLSTCRSLRLPLVHHRVLPEQDGLHQRNLQITRPSARVRGCKGSLGAAP